MDRKTARLLQSGYRLIRTNLIVLATVVLLAVHISNAHGHTGKLLLMVHFHNHTSTNLASTGMNADVASFGVSLLVCTISAAFRVLPILTMAAVGHLMAVPRESKAGSAVAVSGAIAALSFATNDVAAPLLHWFRLLNLAEEEFVFLLGLMLTILFQTSSIHATLHIANYLGLNAVVESCRRLRRMSSLLVCLLIVVILWFALGLPKAKYSDHVFAVVLSIIGVIGTAVFILIAGFLSYFDVCGKMIRALERG